MNNSASIGLKRTLHLNLYEPFLYEPFSIERTSEIQGRHTGLELEEFAKRLGMLESQLVGDLAYRSLTMIRSSIWDYNINLNVGGASGLLPAATYQVYLWVWEDNSPETYSVSMESKPILTNHNSGTAGHWDRLGPYTVRVDDGITSLLSDEYFYDRNGNLVKDLNKNITVEYNHLNLPKAIRYVNSSNWIENIYSAAGVKLRKIVHTQSDNKSTYYVGGLVYEESVLQFVPTGEGRALPPQVTGKATYTYEYHYKDHLGNLRMAFQKGNTNQFMASMETINAATEEAKFTNVATTRNNEKSSSGTYSAKLTAQNPMGPSRIIKVRRGDRIQASVYGLYATNSSTNTGSDLSLFLQASSGNPAGQTEGSTSWPNLQVGLAMIPRSSQDATLPKAYLRMVFYNKDNAYVKEQIVYIASGADAFQYLQIPQLLVEQTGYVRVFVANESNASVWFDELSITHTESPIVQENHYDPWGLNLAGIETQGNPDHRYKFNGIEKIDDFGLCWNQALYRSYDPQIGRWHQIDPKPSTQETPYIGMDNNPIRYSDPLGDLVREERGEGVTRREHREFKQNIRMLRRDSESFRAMYKDLKKSSHTFIYRSELNFGSKGTLGKTDTEGNNTTIRVNVRGDYKGEGTFFTRVKTTAHETGHAWRELHKLDPAFPKVGENPSAYNIAFARVHEITERGASHISNIVVSELQRSNNSVYDGIKLSATYDVGFTTSKFNSSGKVNFDLNGQVQHNLVQTNGYNVLSPPRDANYYKQKIDIHKEHDVRPLD